MKFQNLSKKIFNKRFVIHALIWLGAAAAVSAVDEIEDKIHDKVENRAKRKKDTEHPSEQPAS